MANTGNGVYIWDTDHNEYRNIGQAIGAKGDTGATGATGATPSISATASVDSNTGTPSISVTKSGTDESPSFNFAFSNIKGESGADGNDGADGVTPDITMTATVDGNTGTPSVTVTKGGTTAAPTFALAFSNLKGADGGGSSTDENVAQTNTTTSASYRVLLSNGANNTTETAGARKSSKLTFNPSTGKLTTTGLQATTINGVTVGDTPAFTDTSVTQTNTTSSNSYRVLLSGGANDTTETGGTYKNTNLKYTPSTGNLQTVQINGVTVGNTPKFTDTWTEMVGATSASNGTAGYVPTPPKSGYNTKFLRADGTWVEPSTSATKMNIDGSNADTTVTFAGKVQEGTSVATGTYAHAEGDSTASGNYSHAEGRDTVASGNVAHAGGYSVTASEYCQFVHGNYNPTMYKMRGSQLGETAGSCFGFGMDCTEYWSDTTVTNKNGSLGIIYNAVTTTLSLETFGIYLLFCTSYTRSTGEVFGATTRMITASGISTGTPTNLSIGQTSNAPATISMVTNNKITIKNSANGRATQFQLVRIA